jgi:hypothetical protein
VITVAPHGSVTYSNEWFYGGELAMVTVAGNGFTQLSVAVYDENGNFVTSNSGYTCMVTWTPIWTGRFTIKVTNLGGSSNLYTMRTN